MVLIFFAAIGSGVTEVALPYYNTVPVPVPGTVQYIEKNIIVTSYCTGAYNSNKPSSFWPLLLPAQVLIPDRNTGHNCYSTVHSCQIGLPIMFWKLKTDEESAKHFTARAAFLLVSFSLGQVGDGLNIFQGIYLVGLGWHEGSVGMALSLMGFTALIVQPFAGNLVDVTSVDRRFFLAVAALVTAFSASAIFFVGEGNTDHMIIFLTKIVEGVASSFIAPCLAALTLASFGPDHFDAIMASNILWGHIGTSVAAVLAGLVAYVLFPDIKFCFLVIGASALLAVFFTQYLPQGDQLMGRGFQGDFDLDENGQKKRIGDKGAENNNNMHASPEAASYACILLSKEAIVLCLTGFFFQ